MKKALIVFLVLIFYSGYSFSQLPARPVPFTKIGIVEIKQPLLIIGTLETDYNSLVIDTENLKIIKTYKDSLELIPFGEKGRNGIVLATLKTKTPLLRLEEVLDYYKIPAQDRNLKVLVNKRMINPALFLADVKRIERIERTKQDINSTIRYSFNNTEEYLNIVTLSK
ncbi:MAG: hypothetical protein JWQ14_3020 [Adhaeribacter sp.]|nr:hypothetical protein [Adhaeribacter sp.]